MPNTVVDEREVAKLHENWKTVARLQRYCLLDSNIIMYLEVPNSEKEINKKTKTLVTYLKRQGHTLCINSIVFAEVSGKYESLGQVHNALTSFCYLQFPSFDFGFYAAKAYHEYLKRGGKKEKITPDFYIGAHANLLGIPLVTCNSSDFKYFPNLELINPSSWV